MAEVAVQVAEKTSIREKIQSFKQYITYPNVLLAIAWLMCLTRGLLPALEQIYSIGLLGIALLLWQRDEFYLMMAFFVFFLDQFYVVGTTPAYRLFSYIALIKFITELPKVRFRIAYLPAIAVFILFCLFGVGRNGGIRLGLNLLADLVIVYTTLTRMKAVPELFRKLLFMYTLVAVAAGVYSLAAGNVIAYEVGRESVRSEEIVRYCATFGDANYAGFYYNIAIFTLFSLKRPNLAVRLPVLLILHYFMLLTNSITSFIGYLLCMALFIVLRYPKKAPIIFGAAFFSLLAGVVLVMTIPALNQISFINNVVIRVSEQIRYFESGRMDMFTSGRTDIWSYFWGHFEVQNILGKLFGGNVVTSALTEDKFVTFRACHQVYIQGLLTFGILGSVVVFSTIIGKFFYKIRVYFRTRLKDENSDFTCVIAIATLMWLFFGFSIDFFLDWRFMFFFFI